MELLTDPTNLIRTATCPQHGEYLSTATPFPVPEGFAPRAIWSGCAPCSDQRKRDAEERTRVEAEREAAREVAAVRHRRRQRLMESGIPPRFQCKRLTDYTTDNDGQRDALRAVKNYVADFDDAHDAGRNLLLIGKPGCGKTHLACAVGLEVLNAGRSVRYTTITDMVRRLTDTWRNRDGECESEVLAELGTVDLLILDEAGMQSGSNVELTKICEVIDRRYNAPRPTIVISNLGVEALKPLVGDRVIDRLRDSGSQLIAFDWPSYRGKRDTR